MGVQRLAEVGQARFITFSCHRHRNLLEPTWARDAVMNRLALTKDRLAFRLFAWCIMPDHVHLLIKAQEEVAGVSRILSSLKTKSSKEILEKYAQEPGLHREAESAIKERRLWEHGGGHDRPVFSEQQFRQKLCYVLENPVKAGFSLTPEDYPWCSLGSAVLPGDPWWD